MKKNPLLVIIVPSYNEEQVLEKSFISVKLVMEKLISKKKVSNKSYKCFVDDGSKDKTWDIVVKLNKKSKFCRGIKLSRNFGHQNAVLAGLNNNKADVYVTIDADLQDDENVIMEMIENYHKGSHIVYGVRNSRNVDSFFKRFSAKLFYKIMLLMKVDIIYNHADFRLMSREVIENLRLFDEVNLFIRAVVPLIGFKSSSVYYDRKIRTAGETKYPLKKMLAFAWGGITAFSVFPLRIITFTGFLVFFISMFGIVFSLYRKLTDNVVPGWTSIMLPVFFIGGIQLLSLGVIGEYISKIYNEVKNRPKFIVEKEL